MPASFNGVAGLRPTKGCYANDDLIVPLSSTRDTPGEITPPGQGNSIGCLLRGSWDKGFPFEAAGHALPSDTGL